MIFRFSDEVDIMENLKIAFNCVFPICMVLAVGYWFGQKGIVPRLFFTELSKLNFYVLGFFLMFDSIYRAELSVSFRTDVVIFLCVFVFLSFYLAGLILSRVVSDKRTCGAIWQTAFRGNIGVIGVALAKELMDDPATQIFVVAVLGAMVNILGVYALEKLRGNNLSIGQLLPEVIKNPLVLGCLSGLLFNLLHFPIPTILGNTMTTLGNATVPMSLLALGATLDLNNLRQNKLRVLLCSAFRLILIPTIAIAIAILIGFREDRLCVVMLTTAMPLPTAAFTMATVYDSDSNLTGQIVVASSLLCCLTLFCWILLLKQFALI